MVQKNNVIRKKDFEKYNLLIPFGYAAGKRRKQYVYSELEKMHPCFSDEFCFDSAVRKIGRKGINADVLVMNKMTLAEYEGRRHFCGTGFFAEESGNRRRFFISGKIKNFITAGIACLIVGCSGIFCGAVCAHANEKFQKSAPAVTEAIVVQTNQDADKENWNLAEFFFQKVLEYKGKIDSFEWKFDGGYETISASLKGIFPENLYELENWKKNSQTAQVIYENNEPEMKVSYAKKNKHK